MMNEQKNAEIEIRLTDVMSALLSKIWLIVAVAVVSFALMTAYCFISYEPEYTSTSAIYILKQQSENSSQVNTTDLAVAANIIEDCKYILLSREVLEKVITNVGIEDMSYKQLRSSISIDQPEESRVIEVMVRADSPENAKAIVDELSVVCAEAIVRIMSVDQVNVIDAGSLPENPSNSKFPISKYFLAILAVLVTCAVIIVKNMFDTKIKSAEDIEKYLGLTVLGTLPHCDSEPTAKSKMKYGERKYGDLGREEK